MAATDSSAEKREQTLLITGFGPFGDFQVNPSWEVAKSVNVPGVKVVREYLSVDYDQVNRKVPELWQEHQPDLVIHCGVSALAEGLVFEKIASCGLYTRKDVKGKCVCVVHSSGCGLISYLCFCVCICVCVTLRGAVKGCVPSSCGEEESLCTQVDVCAVVDHLNCLLAQGQITIPSFTSTDAGR